MDSYEKMVVNYWGLDTPDLVKTVSEGLLSRVFVEDKAEVLTKFTIGLLSLDNPYNFRIFPHDQREEFYEVADKGCCGSWNETMKCSSGNMYRLGCNYGH